MFTQFRKRINLFLFTLFLSLNAVSPSWALLIIDMEPTSFGKHVSHGNNKKSTEEKKSHQQLRVVVFNVDEQEFKEISYHMVPIGACTEKNKKNKDISKLQQYSFECCGLEVKYSLQGDVINMSIAPNAIEKGVWCLFSGSILGQDPEKVEVSIFTLDKPRGPRTLIRRKGEKYFPFEDIYSLINRYVKRGKKYGSSLFEGKFLIAQEKFESSYYMSGEKGIYALVGGEQHGTETGFLGELATDLTFLPMDLLGIVPK